jgi:hypothetical protein
VSTVSPGIKSKNPSPPVCGSLLKFNLSTLKTFNKNDYDSYDDNNPFRDVIYEFNGFSDLDSFLQFTSISEDFLIVINDLSVNPINELPINFLDEEAYDDGFNKFLSNNYIKTDTLKLELDNIIEEYLLIKSIDDLRYFIDNRCVDTINKNEFCEILINKYFISNKEISDEIIQLIKQLVKSHILFKSNYSRGLILVYNNWEEISMDYDTSNSKIKLLLSTLRSVGITKGLEHLLEKYQV